MGIFFMATSLHHYLGLPLEGPYALCTHGCSSLPIFSAGPRNQGVLRKCTCNAHSKTRCTLSTFCLLAEERKLCQGHRSQRYIYILPQ